MVAWSKERSRRRNNRISIRALFDLSTVLHFGCNWIDLEPIRAVKRTVTCEFFASVSVTLCCQSLSQTRPYIRTTVPQLTQHKPSLREVCLNRRGVQMYLPDQIKHAQKIPLVINQLYRGWDEKKCREKRKNRRSTAENIS